MRGSPTRNSGVVGRSAQLIVAESTRSMDVKFFVDVGLTIEEEIREIKEGYIDSSAPTKNRRASSSPFCSIVKQ